MGLFLAGAFLALFLVGLAIGLALVELSRRL